MKISFIAPSCYGKTTVVNIIKNKLGSVNLKVAEPLYELQNYFYHFIKKDILDRQDGELLQYFGNKIRQENPSFLMVNFNERILKLNNNIITNDDCRPLDYKFLKEMGFVFVKINGYKRKRTDHIKAKDNHSLEWQSEIPFDYELNNFGTIKELEENTLKLIKEIINYEVLCNTNRKMFK